MQQRRARHQSVSGWLFPVALAVTASLCLFLGLDVPVPRVAAHPLHDLSVRSPVLGTAPQTLLKRVRPPTRRGIAPRQLLEGVQNVGGDGMNNTSGNLTSLNSVVVPVALSEDGQCVSPFSSRRVLSHHCAAGHTTS